MARIRPISTVTVEPPQIDGLIASGGHHWGYNWEFDEDAQTLTPTWRHAGTEYIPSLRACAPMAYTAWADMALTEWQAYDYSASTWGNAESHADWRLSRPAWGAPRIEYLHLRDASAGAIGQLKSEANLNPHVHLRMIRYPPVDGETQVPSTWIQFLGDGTNTYSYGISLPYESAESAGPEVAAMLYRWPYGEDASTARLPIATHDVPYGGLRASELEIIVEQMGDYLRIAFPIEGTDDWIFQNDDDVLVAGPVVVGMQGLNGCLAVEERTVLDDIWYRQDTVAGENVLRWQASAPDPTTGWTNSVPFCVPRNRITLATIMQTGIGSASFGVVGETPGDSTITPDEDEDAGGTATRPSIWFDMHTATQRPWCVRVQQYHDATFDAGSGSSEEIDPDRVSWHRNSDWRGAHFTAEYSDDAVGESIIEVPPNSKMTFAEVWDEGQDPSPTPVDRIVGYTRGMHRRRVGSHRYGAAQPRIEAHDHPSSRLRKHFMRSMPTFQGWTASDIFSFVLNSAGVPDSLITVDAAVDSTYTLPDGVPPWEKHFSFGHTYRIESAFDELFIDYWDLQWGWNASGYFLREMPTWGGIGTDTVDWTVDRDEATAEDACWELQVMVSIDEFANYVMETTPDGNYWLAYDADSHRLTTADNYVGEDFWAANSGANNLSDAADIAQARLDRLSRFACVISFTTAYDGLAPDEFVAATNWDVPEFETGSVFRVLEEDGSCWSDGMDNGVEITYTCGVEEFAAAV